MGKRHVRDGITGGCSSRPRRPPLHRLVVAGYHGVLGIAIGAGLVFRGRYLAGAVLAAIFFSIPLLTKTDIPWNIFGPLILIGLGVVVLLKAFVLREE